MEQGVPGMRVGLSCVEPYDMSTPGIKVADVLTSPLRSVGQANQ